MKKYLPLFLLSYFLLLFSCSPDIDSSTNPAKTQYGFEWQMLDSFEIDISKHNYYCNGFKNGKYLFYEYQSGAVLIIDEQGKILSKFNKKGPGSHEYEVSISMNAFLFPNDNISLVGPEDEGLKIYQPSGTFSRHISFRKDEIYLNNIHLDGFSGKYGIPSTQDSNGHFVYLNGSMIIQTNTFTPAYFESHKYITALNVDTEKTISGVMHRIGSPYLNFADGLLLPHAGNQNVFFDVCTNDNLAVVFPYSDSIHFYNTPDLKYKYSIPAYLPNHNKIKGVPLHEENRNADQIAFENYIKFPNYTSLSALPSLGKNSFAVTYLDALKNHDGDIDRFSYHSEGFHDKRKRFVRIYNDDFPMANDILIPQDFERIQIYDIDHILVRKKITDDKIMTRKFYTYALKEKM